MEGFERARIALLNEFIPKGIRYQLTPMNSFN